MSLLHQKKAARKAVEYEDAVGRLWAESVGQDPTTASRLRRLAQEFTRRADGYWQDAFGPSLSGRAL